jgi:hypothetical protein
LIVKNVVPNGIDRKNEWIGRLFTNYNQDSIKADAVAQHGSFDNTHRRVGSSPPSPMFVTATSRFLNNGIEINCNRRLQNTSTERVEEDV